MDYKKHYDALIAKASKRDVPKGYTEKHHIIPLCMEGDNSRSNLVDLTAREHYIAHALLFKHYKTPSLAHAWFQMCRQGKGQQRSFTARQYSMVKTAHAMAMRDLMKGSSNRFYGKRHTPETKAAISRKAKHRWANKSARTPEGMAQWVRKVASKPKSPEHRSKIGRKGMVVLQNVETLETIRVPREHTESLGREWVHPRKINPEKKHKCQYCECVTTASNLKRWHNDNCKHKPKD